MIKKEITAAHAGQLLRSYLQSELGLSQRFIKKLKATPNGIQVNGVHQTVRYSLQTGDILTLHFPEEEVGESLIAEPLPLDIVYEDDSLLVIDKPAQISTIPSREHPSATIANGLLHYYREKNLPYTVHVVTRLDKDTSGLLLIAKHQHAHHLLSQQLQKGLIERNYRAFIQGKIKPEKGMINAPIGRKDDSIIERIVTPKGQHACTHYEVHQQTDRYSDVHIQLETGRTHQIRVHFSYMGHPLLGDSLYGGNRDIICRQALHAYQLRLEHPITKEPLVFMSPLPEDMAGLAD